ncbi:IncP plasmid survival protein KfrC family protein [Xanthomonas translucens pv. undulosa]|nr:IncP plasmid survival protein KfrC family protein [Xanthomonas translucens]
MLAAAEAADTEQQAALEAAPLDQTYQEALALYVQAKHDQVERVEDRLENLIERQQARLQQTQANQPGLLTRPGAKRAWQNQQMQQQARLQSLHVRLEAVREIKEGMGLHSPKVEELATRKMRAENPELASDWDAMREAARRHQALLRREEQEKKQAQTLERPGRSQSLGLTRAV